MTKNGLPKIFQFFRQPMRRHVVMKKSLYLPPKIATSSTMAPIMPAMNAIIFITLYGRLPVSSPVCPLMRKPFRSLS